MIRSYDDLIRVDVIGNVCNSVSLVGDFSIINLPLYKSDSQNLFKNLFNNPSSKHITLLLNRHKRKDKLEAMKNLPFVTEAGFEYLDSISIWYEKPNSCSNNGFLPVCETGYLFYKGTTPDVKNTAWFGEDTSNATNLWNVTSSEKEGSQATHYQKFCWEIPLLLLSMSKPLENRRFVYNIELSDQELDSIFRFCKFYNIGVQLFASTDQQGGNIVRTYNTNYSK